MRPLSSCVISIPSDELGMKTKIKNLVKVTVIFMVLSLAFNNCGQPGEIKFDKLGSTTDVGSKDNSAQDNPTANDPDSAGPNIPGSNPGAPVTPVTPGNPTVPVTPPVVVVPPTGPVVVVPPTNPSAYQEKILNLKINAVEKVDILFVIDNSISMAYEQENMADRFNKFIQSIEGLDWQIGIITTDVSDPYLASSDGKLLKFESLNTFIIDSRMDKKSVQNAFAETIQRKESGSGYEQGILATSRFLERDKQRVNKLLRNDSALSVVIISDADETPWNDSFGKPVYQKMNKPSELIKYIESAWPGKKYQFHSIVVRNGDSECLAQSDNEGTGDYYISLSNLTKGVVGSVCEKDYGSQLKFMGEKVQELVKTVALECEPVDTNGDGKLDIEISSEYSEVPEIERIQGKSLFFRKNLSVGSFKIKYFCQK